MRGPTRARIVMLVLGYFSVVTIAPAHAYVDPGTGSYLLQILVGGFLAVGLFVKGFWRHILGFFSRRKSS